MASIKTRVKLTKKNKNKTKQGFEIKSAVCIIAVKSAMAADIINERAADAAAFHGRFDDDPIKTHSNSNLHLCGRCQHVLSDLHFL